jgi:23S rRNA pseudouridine2605 synthase
VRLAKYLASAGIASRRASEEIVRSGRVTLNGAPVTDPARDVGVGDTVAVDGASAHAAQTRVVYAVNKPAGVVCTARDPQRRPTVVSLVPVPLRLYPVGRLDVDTTGLILLTNDGELAHRLTHPRYEVEKTYRARVANPPVSKATLERLRSGIRLEDGVTAPARVKRLAPDTLELTIHEGRKRQVRRMCKAVGHPVQRLERVRFGPLELGSLESGRYRRLTAAEIAALAGASAGAATRPGGASSSSARARPPAG